ncbi:Germin subfamily 1 member 15 [Caballeronia hypogeia]|uniref:Germin subfamily 1 member 15 n=1 Tax=Caballeronia hypogeia TaxID=1777140 RepID=A0A158A9H9_9BURK|nr:Germin subfamily 1 member 15 [Caballeronia hypogeia]
MRSAAYIVASAFLSVPLTAFAADGEPERITIAHSGSQPSVPGSTQRFTGQVRIDPLFQSKAPSRLSGGLVTFEPGARTAWHTHPLGQTLIVTSGRGWTQQWGQERHEIAAGDVVSIPAGVKHWHGATSTTGMTHIALQEALDSKNVNWLEQVTDEQYRRP